MSKAEILAELPKLKAEDRMQVFQLLCELQESDVLNSVGPTDGEKKLLDKALAEYHRDGDPGIPWREAPRQLRGQPIRAAEAAPTRWAYCFFVRRRREKPLTNEE